MECPSCGANVKDGSKFCEFCGSSITADMKRDQEYVNKAGCPKCGSSNIKFDREKQGEIRGKEGITVVRSTVGFCKDCGYTWHTDGSSTWHTDSSSAQHTTDSSNQSKKKKTWTWLWVLGWLCIPPVPLTILLLRKKDMKPSLRHRIIAVVWIAYLLLGLVANLSDSESSTTENTPDTVAVESNVDTTHTSDKQ